MSVQALNANIGTWGAGATDSLNTGCFQPLDNMLGGITALSLSSSTPQLLTQTQAQNALLRVTGALLASIVISPDTGVLMQGFYYFENLTTNPSFSVTFTNTAGSVILPQGRRGILWIDTTNGPRVMSSIGASQTDIIPYAYQIPFYNNSVPTGWTVLAINDYGMRIVSSGGGSASGALGYSTVFARTATDSYTLTLSDIPSHQHAVGVGTVAAGSGATGIGNSSSVNTTATGAGGGHSHGMDMRVATLALMLGQRNNS